MDTIKYNQNYLDYIAGEFSKTVLQIFQERFLDTHVVEMTQENKEKFVSEVIKNQFNVAKELAQKQQKLGDSYIEFFMDKEVMHLYACCYLSSILKMEEAKEAALNAIEQLWIIKKAVEDFQKMMEEVEQESERKRK